MTCINLRKLLPLIITIILSIVIILIIVLKLNIALNLKMDYNNEEIIQENPPILDEDINSTQDQTKYMEMLSQKYAEKKVLALTFDDGPSKYTHDLIDELNKRNINVTFFVLGENIEKYSDSLEFAFDSGNEIGIHSYKHKLFTKLNKTQIKEQITLTSNLINDTINFSPNLIRVPYGSINTNVQETIEDLGLTSILWDVDTLDWKFKNTQKTYNYALKKIKGNDIILMHDSFSTSTQAAILLIDKLTEKGYVFITVSKLLELKETN